MYVALAYSSVILFDVYVLLLCAKYKLFNFRMVIAL